MIIYLLCLEQKKYYVGRTNDIVRRYQEHLEEEGCQWTKVYKPYKYKILVEQGDMFDEDKYVFITMMKKGIDNVRGGSYCQFHLSPKTKQILYNHIANATDRCFKCGKIGHYANECPNKEINVYQNPNIAKKSLVVRKCGKCGVGGHNVRTCTKT